MNTVIFRTEIIFSILGINYGSWWRYKIYFGSLSRWILWCFCIFKDPVLGGDFQNYWDISRTGVSKFMQLLPKIFTSLLHLEAAEFWENPYIYENWCSWHRNCFKIHPSRKTFWNYKIEKNIGVLLWNTIGTVPYERCLLICIGAIQSNIETNIQLYSNFFQWK